MATTVTSQKISVNLVLKNRAAEDDGSRFYISLGQLNKATFDADKVMAIKALFEPCLAKDIDHVEKLELSTLEASA